jgi:hypothetical protein
LASFLRYFALVRILLISIFIFIASFGSAYAQQESVVHGLIVAAADSNQMMAHVHVLNKQQGYGTVSNLQGMFQVKARPMDSLEFRMIGYRDTVISVTDLEKLGFVMPLYERIGVMKSVTVFGEGYKTFAPPKPSADPYIGYEMVKPSGREPVEQKVGLGYTGNGAALEGAITAFANLFNKKHKQRERIRELQAQDRRKEYYNALFEYWFDEEFVTKLTGLEGRDLKKFLEFCRPSLQFLEEANEYDIIMAIWRYHDQYDRLINPGIRE